MAQVSPSGVNVTDNNSIVRRWKGSRPPAPRKTTHLPPARQAKVTPVGTPPAKTELCLALMLVRIVGGYVLAPDSGGHVITRILGAIL